MTTSADWLAGWLAGCWPPLLQLPLPAACTAHLRAHTPAAPTPLRQPACLPGQKQSAEAGSTAPSLTPSLRGRASTCPAPTCLPPCSHGCLCLPPWPGCALASLLCSVRAARGECPRTYPGLHGAPCGLNRYCGKGLVCCNVRPFLAGLTNFPIPTCQRNGSVTDSEGHVFC